MKDSMKEADIPNVIESLKELNGKSEDKIKIDDYVRELEERLVFLKTKARAIENNQLFNIILNDLKYYKEKETDRLKRK